MDMHAHGIKTSRRTMAAQQRACGITAQSAASAHGADSTGVRTSGGVVSRNRNRGIVINRHAVDPAYLDSAFPGMWLGPLPKYGYENTLAAILEEEKNSNRPLLRNMIPYVGHNYKEKSRRRYTMTGADMPRVSEDSPEIDYSAHPFAPTALRASSENSIVNSVPESSGITTLVQMQKCHTVFYDFATGEVQCVVKNSDADALAFYTRYYENMAHISSAAGNIFRRMAGEQRYILICGGEPVRWLTKQGVREYIAHPHLPIALPVDMIEKRVTFAEIVNGRPANLDLPRVRFTFSQYSTMKKSPE